MMKKTWDLALRYHLHRIAVGLVIIAIIAAIAAVTVNSGIGVETEANAGEMWTMLGQLVLVGGGMGLLQWGFFWLLTRIGDLALRARIKKGK